MRPNQKEIFRKKAEDQLNRQISATTSPLSKIDTLKLIHELEANQNLLAKQKDELRESNYSLGERVKELNCLYLMSELISNDGISLPEILQSIVELIPPAWQYPNFTCARITFNDETYITKNFKETPWMQMEEIFQQAAHDLGSGSTPQEAKEVMHGLLGSLSEDAHTAFNKIAVHFVQANPKLFL